MAPRYTPIPSAPLIEYVARRGGPANLAEIMDLGVPVDRPISGKQIRIMTADEERRGELVRKTLRRAVLKGTIDLYGADEICVNDFGIHPAQVWGMAWFDFHPNEPVRDAGVRLSGEIRVLEVAA